MTLIRRNDPMSVSRFFEEMLNENKREMTNEYVWKPRANVMEQEDRFEIELAVPGMNKEDFSISIEKDLLTIEASSTEETKEQNANFTRREFAYGKLSRAFSLPENVDRDAIKAEYVNGILKLTLPKTEKEILKRQVKIA